VFDAAEDILRGIGPAESAVDAVAFADVDRVAESPERVADFLSRVVLNDRARINLLSAPSTAEFVDALHGQKAETPVQVADFVGRVLRETEHFEPNPLWLAWMLHIHADSLAQIRTELLRRTKESSATP
jgi:hypothetical protein